jgi:serine/threonine protein kinase
MTEPFVPGDVVAEGYRVVEHLSRGRVLDVYDAVSEERDARCIVKRLRGDATDDQVAARRLVAEGRLMCRLTHPHIVRGYEVITDRRRAATPTVVMETLTGATLARVIDDAVPRLSVPEVAHLGIHLASALGYLHRQGWVHLDVKPSNVIASSGRAVLIDFSIARRPGRGRAGVGTWCYLSPEQARGGRVGPPADVWGLGAVLYEALTGRCPFDDGSDHAGQATQDPSSRTARDDAGRRLHYRQLDGPPVPVSSLRRVDRDLASLVGRCLDPDPVARPSTTEVRDTLTGLIG